MLMELAIIDALQNSPNLIYLVNSENQFGFLNSYSVKTLGFASEEHALANGYADIRCDASELAPYYKEQDKLTLSTGKPTTWLALARYRGRDNRTLFYGTKSPVFDKRKKIVGVLANFMDVTDHRLINLSDLFLGDAKFFNKTNDQVTYEVANHAWDDMLSPREAVVLFYVLRGQSSINIASRLCRSSRTIESHIENIKTKMGCHSKFELIEKGIDQGLLSILPRHIFNLNLKF